MGLILGIDPVRDNLPVSRDRGGERQPIGHFLREMPDSGANSNPNDEGLVGLYPYSGADIKLVVHLAAEDPRAVGNDLEEAEAEQDRIRTALESAPNADAVTQLNAQLASIRSQLEVAHEQTSYFEAGNPRDPGDPTAEELIEDIERLNEQEANVTSRINDASRAGTRETLEADARIAARQVEELRSQTPSGTTARTKVLGEIQTLSISDHREKYPVRTLGSVYPRSITRGPRTISGSLVFTTFNQHVMHEFLEATEYRSTGVGDFDRFRYSSYVMDQIPPLDISISFANEYGNLSWMAILGVEFVNEGQVMSIEDLFIEGTAQYIARDFDPIRSVANRRLSRTNGVGQALRGTDIMSQDLRNRVAHRNVPWI